MNATSDSLAVVKARLPYTDRGSFSEAWFSALRLGAEGAGGAGGLRPHRPLDAAAVVASDARRAATEGTRMTPGAAHAPARRDATARAAAGERAARVDRRRDGGVSERVPAVRRAPASAPLRATLSLGDGGSRVQILLRREGATIRVVALCSARNVELVRRALAAAQASLQADGCRIEGSVRTIDPEAGA